MIHTTKAPGFQYTPRTPGRFHLCNSEGIRLTVLCVNH